MKKDLPIIFAVFLIAVLLIKGTDFQTVDEYYLTHIDDITPESQVVTLSIDCSSAVKSDKLDKGLKDSGKLPDDGMILPETKYFNGKSLTTKRYSYWLCRSCRDKLVKALEWEV